MNVHELSTKELRSIAPAMFSEAHAPGLSSKYAHFNTAHIVERLGNEGFYPVRAFQARTRSGRSSFAKHQVALRAQGQQKILGGLYPEINIRTDHAGLSSWKVDIGMFRLVCLNGMVVGAGHFDTIRIRHTRKTMDEVLLACIPAAKRFSAVSDTVARMIDRKLTLEERVAMAEFGLKLRFPAIAPIPATELLLTHRKEDQRSDLWTTLNVIQENVIRGGAYVKNRRVRGIFEIDRSTDINKALWDNAEQMLVNRSGGH